MVFDGLDAGDESRRDGDYVGVEHDETNDGVSAGELVTINSSGVLKAASADPGSEDLAGVLYTYQYYEDAQTGETIKQDEDATVKTAGTVIADLDTQSANVTVGSTLGGNGEVLVLEESDSGTNHYEVLLR